MPGERGDPNTPGTQQQYYQNMMDDFDDLPLDVRQSIQGIIKKLTAIRVKEEITVLKKDIRDQLADQKTQT